MSEVVLTGLDGSNPLGFLAALGVLRVLDDGARAEGGPRPTLAWRLDGRWLPVVGGVGSVEEVVERVIGDVGGWRRSAALSLAYDDAGALVAPETPKATLDLKPPPASFRLWLEGVVQAADTRSYGHAAAYGSELCTDNNGNLKPNALHFTAGQQTFLRMVRALAEGVGADDIREALVGPWRVASVLPSLSWDASVSRLYALRSGNPALEKRGSTPGADWLGFVALGWFPSVVQRGRLRTAGVEGGWKDSRFTWPLWTCGAGAGPVRSLLTLPGLAELPASVRALRGIGAVMQSDIQRSDQGGYGSFAPSRVV